MTDDRSMPYDHEPLNRAERRAQRFRPKAGQADPHAVAGGGVASDEDPDATPSPSAEAEAVTISGSADVTRMTGAGTGGATESDDRQPHHEGAHFGNQPNS